MKKIGIRLINRGLITYEIKSGRYTRYKFIGNPLAVSYRPFEMAPDSFDTLTFDIEYNIRTRILSALFHDLKSTNMRRLTHEN